MNLSLEQKKRLARGAGWVALGVIGLFPIVKGDRNLIHLGTLAGLWALWATSLNVVWGYAGQFSMAQIGLGAASAYTSAILVGNNGWATWLAIPAGIAAAVAASVIIGIFALKLRGFYFSIMTLAFALVLLSVIRNSQLAGRATGLSVQTTLGQLNLGPLRWNLDSREGGFYLVVLLSVILFALATGRLLATRSGRALLAIREDQVLASSLGVHAARYRVIAFGLSAVVSGTAGVLMATYYRFISPDLFGFEQLVHMIVILVVGGAGLRLGPVIGGVLYIFMVEGLRFGGEYRASMFGVLLILIVLFARDGLVGRALTLYNDVLQRRRRGKDSALAPTVEPPGPPEIEEREPVSVEGLL